MKFDKTIYAEQFKECMKEHNIKQSKEFFKIKLFLQKAENSLQIAIYQKNLTQTKDMPKKIYWDYWTITIAYYSMLYAAKAAIASKGYEVSTHDAAQIAVGYLLVPEQIEKEDLELLNKSGKIFEDEYVQYFEDAKTESHIARYTAIQSYTTRRVEEIVENARRFVAKITLILGNN